MNEATRSADRHATTSAEHCRFVESLRLYHTHASMTAKVPIGAHRQVLELCARFGVHPLRFYRDAFNAGLRERLEEAIRAWRDGHSGT